MMSGIQCHFFFWAVEYLALRVRALEGPEESAGRIAGEGRSTERLAEDNSGSGIGLAEQDFPRPPNTTLLEFES